MSVGCTSADAPRDATNVFALSSGLSVLLFRVEGLGLKKGLGVGNEGNK